MSSFLSTKEARVVICIPGASIRNQHRDIRKAAGYDQINYEVLKKSLEKTGPLLLSLFNECWNSGEIPENWKIGLLIPIYKNKGPRNDPQNYRGITLLSCIMKTYTGLIYQRLYFWAELYEMLPDNQYGFRKERSTLQAVSRLKNDIDRGISTIGRYYVCF